MVLANPTPQMSRVEMVHHQDLYTPSRSPPPYTKQEPHSLCSYKTCRVGQNHIHTVYISNYIIFGREITKYTVIYGVYIRFWATL